MTATPSPTIAPTPAYVTPGPLPAGLYGVDIGKVQFTFTIPAGWVGPPSPGFAVIKERPDGGGMILSFWWPLNVYADPCDPRSLLDSGIGPGVDELVNALVDQSLTEAQDPSPTVIHGFEGQRLDLAVRTDAADCDGDLWLWLDKDGGRRSTDVDEDNELWILDVEGERVMIDVVYEPDATVQERAEMAAVFDTIQITVTD